MDDLKEIKERIYLDENIEKLLEALGCEYVNHERNGERITAQLPHGDNKRSIQVKNNDSLTSVIRSKGISGDIYSIVGYVLYDCKDFKELLGHLYDCKRFVCETLGYDEYLTGTQKKKKIYVKKDWNGWLREIRKKRTKETDIEYNRVLDEKILEQYHLIPNYWWLEEDGIDFKTQMEFEVGFDLKTKRIVFPIRDRYGRLIGVKGRYKGKNKYIMDEQKYIYIIPCNKSIELFNFHKALPHILECKEVIIVEAEKSVMKLWQYGYKNAVAIGGDSITPEQIKIIKGLGLDITSVFAWDKGKDLEFITTQIKPLIGRKVQYITDDSDSLNEKDSPVDKGLEVWQMLYDNRNKANWCLTV